MSFGVWQVAALEKQYKKQQEFLNKPAATSMEPRLARAQSQEKSTAPSKVMIKEANTQLMMMFEKIASLESELAKKTKELHDVANQNSGAGNSIASLEKRIQEFEVAQAAREQAHSVQLVSYQEQCQKQLNVMKTQCKSQIQELNEYITKCQAQSAAEVEHAKSAALLAEEKNVTVCAELANASQKLIDLNKIVDKIRLENVELKLVVADLQEQNQALLKDISIKDKRLSTIIPTESSLCAILQLISDIKSDNLNGMSDMVDEHDECISETAEPDATATNSITEAEPVQSSETCDVVETDLERHIAQPEAEAVIESEDVTEAEDKESTGSPSDIEEEVVSETTKDMNLGDTKEIESDVSSYTADVEVAQQAPVQQDAVEPISDSDVTIEEIANSDEGIDQAVTPKAVETEVDAIETEPCVVPQDETSGDATTKEAIEPSIVETNPNTGPVEEDTEAATTDLETGEADIDLAETETSDPSSVTSGSSYVNVASNGSSYVNVASSEAQESYQDISSPEVSCCHSSPSSSNSCERLSEERPSDPAEVLVEVVEGEISVSAVNSIENPKNEPLEGESMGADESMVVTETTSEELSATIEPEVTTKEEEDTADNEPTEVASEVGEEAVDSLAGHSEENVSPSRPGFVFTVNPSVVPGSIIRTPERSLHPPQNTLYDNSESLGSTEI